MKYKLIFLSLIIVGMIILSGCQPEATPSSNTNTSTQVENTHTDKAPSSNPDPAQPEMNNPMGEELDTVTYLNLGTLKLEGTENAVTPEQAVKLLPLWQMVQENTLQNDAETNNVTGQIEEQMTEAQLKAIEAMSLTFADLETWMQEQGIEMRVPGDGANGPGVAGDMSEEERAQMREQLQNMTPEERATAMAEAEAEFPEGSPEGGQGVPPENGQGTPPEGGSPPEGSPGMGQGRGMGGNRMLLEPLITLLTERAAE
ncbi:MAG: hypothetical protein JXA33_02155 [Anaerolineae bacterium]|nr:hypothetical protein [Anaerolineae bacterium]